MELRERRPYEWPFGWLSLLISTPRNVKGAQQLIAHELLAVRFPVIADGKRYSHSTDSNDHSCTVQRLHKWGHDHRARKNAVRHGPHSKQRRLIFLNLEHERCDARWWTASELWAFIIGAFDDERKQD
jgi:hypothetical protein